MLATKAVLVTVESTDPRTNIMKGPFIPKAIGEIVETSKKLEIPPPQEGGGQELNANINGLANLGTLQVSNFESNVQKIIQLLLSKIQCFTAGSLSKFHARWLELTSDPCITAKCNTNRKCNTH